MILVVMILKNTLDYKISKDPPEGIYEKAKELWKVDFENTVFTYGDTIHSKYPLTSDVLAHELVHVRQQTEMGKDVWWNRYWTDPQFRLDQEAEAYREQYRTVCNLIADRNNRSKALLFYAQSLSGSMYGMIVSRGEAIKLITQ